MFGRSPSVLILTAVVALIYLFVMHRALDRLRMGKLSALLLVIAMGRGDYPHFLWGDLFANIGGAIIPVGICLTCCRPPPLQQKNPGLITAIVSPGQSDH